MDFHLKICQFMPAKKDLLVHRLEKSDDLASAGNTLLTKILQADLTFLGALSLLVTGLPTDQAPPCVMPLSLHQHVILCTYAPYSS